MNMLGPATVVRRYFVEVLGQHNLAALDELVARDFVGHAIGNAGGGADITRADMRRDLEREQRDMPDAETIVDDLFSAGHHVTTRWRYRWRHDRSLFGEPPTGEWLELAGVTIDQVANGKIVERWEIKDDWGLMQRLGGVPTFPPVTPPGA